MSSSLLRVRQREEDDRDQVERFLAERFRGTGTALVEALAKLAEGAGRNRLRVTTTNDNVDALRFYQRRGFRLAALRRGAIDDSRAELKPEIPPVGDHGIDLRDELELDKVPGA